MSYFPNHYSSTKSQYSSKNPHYDSSRVKDLLTRVDEGMKSTYHYPYSSHSSSSHPSSSHPPSTSASTPSSNDLDKYIHEMESGKKSTMPPHLRSTYTNHRPRPKTRSGHGSSRSLSRSSARSSIRTTEPIPLSTPGMSEAQGAELMGQIQAVHQKLVDFQQENLMVFTKVMSMLETMDERLKKIEEVAVIEVEI